MAVIVEVYDRKIDQMFDRPTELRAFMTSRVAATTAEARAIAPTRTHSLQRSISADYLGGGHWTISASSPHAKFVHEGTRPHLIRVRPGKGSMRFQWQRVGGVVFPVVVKHPGTAPNPFLTRAMHSVWDRV